MSLALAEPQPSLPPSNDAEATAKRVVGLPWTPESARLAGLKSAAVRRVIREKERIKAEARASIPTEALPEVAICDAQIQTLNRALACKLKPMERAALLKALDTMMDRKRILLGIALPGSARPSATPDRPSRGSFLLGGSESPQTPGRGGVPQE